MLRWLSARAGLALLTVFLWAALAAALADVAPKASAARLAGDAKRTRFVADVERPISFSAYIVAKPYRVILDLPDVNFQLPPGSGEKGRGLVNAYRFGPLGPGKSRIILDLKGPALIEKAQLVPPENGEPARMVIDLIKTDAKTFAKLAKSEQDRARAKVMPVAGQHTIVIDPGHGGSDPGATSVTGRLEKDLTLELALKLKQQLEARGAYRVLLTRERDAFVPLAERAGMASRAGADLFLALHADVVRGATVKGASIYTLSDAASDAEAAALASRENLADAMGGLDPSAAGDAGGALIGLAQTDSRNRAGDFARHLASELGEVTELTRQPLKSAGFRVLKSPDVPSVLLELGYLSDPAEAAAIADERWQVKAASAITRAVDSYFGN